MSATALIIGASRGLGLSLVQHYAKTLSPNNVFATVQGKANPDQYPKGVNVIENVDATKKDCGKRVVDGLKGRTVDRVWVVAGLLKPEVGGMCLAASLNSRLRAAAEEDIPFNAWLG